MSGEFLDSNVFVYAFDDTDDRKPGIAKDLIVRAIEVRARYGYSFYDSLRSFFYQ